MNSYYTAILQGSLLTVGVSLCALLVSIVLGLLGAAAGAGAASSFLPQATRADAAAATKSNFFMGFPLKSKK
jgi:ABC-type arginine transport system permease subunit